MTTVAVRVKPGASRTAVGGRYAGRNGDALVVAVQAPAVDGRANTATVRALAAALNVPLSSVRVRLGATARDKLIDIDDPPADIDRRIAVLLAG